MRGNKEKKYAQWQTDRLVESSYVNHSNIARFVTRNFGKEVPKKIITGVEGDTVPDLIAKQYFRSS